MCIRDRAPAADEGKGCLKYNHFQCDVCHNNLLHILKIGEDTQSHSDAGGDGTGNEEGFHQFGITADEIALQKVTDTF